MKVWDSTLGLVMTTVLVVLLTTTRSIIAGMFLMVTAAPASAAEFPFLPDCGKRFQ